MGQSEDAIRRRYSRRWVVPPAIERGSTETIDRLGIIAEHAESEALLLWRLVRDVELWAATPVQHRTELFGIAAPEGRTRRLRDSTMPTDVRVLVRSINRILAGQQDAPGCGEDAATACAGVGQWARQIGARETAVAFAQAAALCSGRASHALLTGTCARELGQNTRAASWYSRAVALARRELDWGSYAAAFIALAENAEAAGNIPLARQRYLRAFRAARRFSNLVAARGRAGYGLFRLARDAGDMKAADAYARAATPALMKSQPAGAPLALALAAFWIEQGTPERTLRILKYLPKLDAFPPRERLPAAILRVRAETAAGDAIVARRAWADAWALATDSTSSPPPADVLLELAECAAALGEPSGVEAASRAALIHASEEDFPRIHTELRRIAAGRADFRPPLRGAA